MLCETSVETHLDKDQREALEEQIEESIYQGQV